MQADAMESQRSRAEAATQISAAKSKAEEVQKQAAGAAAAVQKLRAQRSALLRSEQECGGTEALSAEAQDFARAEAERIHAEEAAVEVEAARLQAEAEVRAVGCD
jgi:hypothetical protein